jgi:hypothetical protein
MEREQAWWTSWKARLAVCLVAVLLGALLAGLLMRLTPPSVAGSAATPAPGATLGLSPLPTPLVYVPAGWTQVLPGLILSDFGHFNTLVSSAVQPGRLAACALPPHSWPVSVAPVFVMTDDGGRTWQQRPIPLAGSVWECDLAGDLLNPDTYAVSLIHIIDGKSGGPDETLVTDDAGRTWRRAAMPASMEYSCATLPQQLHMPEWVQADPCTVDPWNPAHLYAVVPLSPSTTNHGLSLYETRDGGSSWHLLHTWPTTYRLQELHLTRSGLYVEDSQDGVGKQGVYRSADGGTTWAELPLKEAWVNYFGLGGRLLATAYPRLFQVDPVTAALTPLGEVPVIDESTGVVTGVITAVAICEGDEPALVVAGPYGTFVRSLPLLG